MRAFVLAAALFPALAQADLKLQELEPKIDAFVKAFQPVEDTGIALGIVKDGELVFFKGYGYRDREKKLPVTPNTLFAIGSATKSFVSVSLAMLGEEGKVSFEEPVKSFLPGFRLESPEASGSATLVDLLSHQTGLPRHDLLWYLTPFQAPELFSKLGFLEMNKKDGMGFRSGKMQYNNLMFMTAGLVLEKQSGKTWDGFVQERLLAPLGMEETFFAMEAFRQFPEPALGYSKSEVLPYPEMIRNVAAAGSMSSTTADLNRWVGFFLNHGASATGERLIGRPFLERLYRKESDASAPDKQIEMGYGLGIMLSRVLGRTVVWHGGNVDGFSAHVSALPEEGLGLIILVNQNGAANFQFPFAVPVGEGKPSVKLLPLLIYEHLLGAAPERPKPVDGLEDALAALDLPGIEPRRASREAPAFVRAAAQDLYRFVGAYGEMAYGTLSASVEEGGSLLFSYYGHKFYLEGTDEALVFKLSYGDERTPTGLQAEFETKGGLITGVKIPFEPEVSPIRFLKAN